MKTILLITLLSVGNTLCLNAQELMLTETQKQDMQSIIDSYTKARETKDPALLESILTNDIDQLVSSGTWRRGKEESMKGMLRSSQNNPRKRSITVDNIRLVTPDCGIVDTRYEIQNSDGTSRKMWSTFILIYVEKDWEISAIRNMLPAG